MPLTALIVRSPNGWFLCDTGLHQDFRRPEISQPLLPWGLPSLSGTGEPVVEALAAVGLTTDDLSGVIMSHLHLDHTGGLHLFRNGPPIYVQREELRVAQSEEGSPEIFYRRGDYLHPDLRWELLDGDQPIVAGIDAISTPGHTAGHMSLRIRMTEGATAIYAFDAVPTMWNVERDEVTPVGGPEWASVKRPASHRKLLDLAPAEGATLVPSHCPHTWDPVGSPPRPFH